MTGDVAAELRQLCGVDRRRRDGGGRSRSSGPVPCDLVERVLQTIEGLRERVADLERQLAAEREQ